MLQNFQKNFFDSFLDISHAKVCKSAGSHLVLFTWGFVVIRIVRIIIRAYVHGYL